MNEAPRRIEGDAAGAEAVDQFQQQQFTEPPKSFQPGSSRRELALQYAARGWPVFPLYEIRDGVCSCRRPNCTSPGKHPRTLRGFKDATTDRAKIEAWWTVNPNANVGISTGPSGLVVLDVDGFEGQAELRALIKTHGLLPRTLMVRTGRPGGIHLFFTGVVPSKIDKEHHIDVRGTTGYVVAPPSNHISGTDYAWIDPTVPAAPVPKWVAGWAAGGTRLKSSKSTRKLVEGSIEDQLGPLPEWLAGMRAPGMSVSEAIRKASLPVRSPEEEARLRSALSTIPADCGYDAWIAIGMALHGLEWTLVREGVSWDIGLELWDAWSATGGTKYPGREAIERKWLSFSRPYFGSKVTVASIYRRAKERGWTDENVPPPPPSDCDHTREMGKKVHEAQGPQDHTSKQEQQEQTNQQEQAGQTGQERDNSQSNGGGGSAQSAFLLRWHGEEDPNIKRQWLVKHLLSTTGAGLISGQWGTGKTFVAIDLAVSVMMGTRFAGRPVKRKGGVLFIAAEGASEIPIRLYGLVETKSPNHKGKFPFAWVENCPPLTDKGAIEHLARIAKEAADHMKAEFGVDLVLIIVDTMSAAAGFKDEKSSSEGQLAMNVLNDLSKRTGALVMACDHFGKAIETGTRGTSAKEAAADVVIACLGDKSLSGSVENTRIAVRKLRGGATGAETAFTVRKVDMGIDEDHEPITTCVVEWSSVTVAAPPKTAKGQSWPQSATVFRRALITALELHGTEQRPFPDAPSVRAVELDRVREEFDKRYPLDGDDRPKQLTKRRQVFKRSRTEAESRGLIGVREIEGNFWVWPIHPEDGAMQAGASAGQQAA